MIKPKMTKESVRKIFDEMADILVKKNEDYKGASFDLGLSGNFVHIWDKVSRLKHLLDNKQSGKKENFEGMEDTYRDIIGYCVIGLHILYSDKMTDEQFVEEKVSELIGLYDDKYNKSDEPLKDIVNAFKRGIQIGKEEL